MNLDHVKHLSEEVRYRAETFARRENRPDSMAGMCAIASGWLSDKFHLEGIEHTIAMWKSQHLRHVFLLVDDHVVDITATQFRGFGNKPLVIMHEREAINYEHWEPCEYFNHSGELRKEQLREKWYSEQIAHDSWPRIESLLKKRDLVTM